MGLFRMLGISGGTLWLLAMVAVLLVVSWGVNLYHKNHTDLNRLFVAMGLKNSEGVYPHRLRGRDGIVVKMPPGLCTDDFTDGKNKRKIEEFLGCHDDEEAIFKYRGDMEMTITKVKRREEK